MFRKNTTHLQRSFFDIENQLSERKKKKIRETEEYSFYQLIFKKIKEENFEENKGVRSQHLTPRMPKNLPKRGIYYYRDWWTAQLRC